jgi:hypothetical protein
MEGYKTLASCVRATVTVVSLVFSAACGQEGLPPQAIFHPGGSQALHASQIDPGDLVVRGAVYVPVYSSIHWGGLDTVTELSATISIRNTDVQQELVLASVTYYDSLGKAIHEYLEEAMALDPMSTVEFVIARSDTRGGNGANFIVHWGSQGPIAEPVMETIMLGQTGNAGISFVSQGRPIRIIKPNSATSESP